MHTHILPNVDDGPDTMDESIKIVEKAFVSGVTTIVATPHVTDPLSREAYKKIQVAGKELVKAIRARGIEINIIVGAEFALFYELPQYIIEYEALAIRIGHKYVLLELPPHEIPMFTQQVLYKIQLNGFIPIIAHPERNYQLQKDPSLLRQYTERGVLTQLDAGSLWGRYGRKAKSTAKKLLKENLIHMMGSDVHRSFRGLYPLIKGVEKAEKIIGKEKAVKLVEYLITAVDENR